MKKKKIIINQQEQIIFGVTIILNNTDRDKNYQLKNIFNKISQYLFKRHHK